MRKINAIISLIIKFNNRASMIIYLLLLTGIGLVGDLLANVICKLFGI